MSPARKATKKAAPRATAQNARDDAQVVLADLFRHVGGRQLQPDDPPKLPTRLKKLEGIDDLPPSVAAAMLPAAGLWADLVLGALDRAGFVLERK